MGFKLLVLPPDDSGSHFSEDWPDRLSKAVQGIDVTVCDSVGEAMEVIGEADADIIFIIADLVPGSHLPFDGRSHGECKIRHLDLMVS